MRLMRLSGVSRVTGALFMQLLSVSGVTGVTGAFLCVF